MADLKVCPKCGWYDHGQLFQSPERCDPKLGKIADELAAQADRAGVKATKLGYGFGMLTFEIDDKTSMTVQPHHDGTFSFRYFHVLGDNYPSDVMLLVEALKAIRLRAATEVRKAR